MSSPTFNSHPPRAQADLDHLLTAQFLVAWAGEGGGPEGAPRLAWWNSDLVSQFGGQDLMKRLAKHTWEWAVLQAVREVARRHDAARRHEDHDADRLVTLFSLGFELDERAEERLQALKRSGQKPLEVLPGLAPFVGQDWDREAFLAWVKGHGDVEPTKVPAGLRLKGSPPADLGKLVNGLVAAFAPLKDEYPAPHYRRAT